MRRKTGRLRAAITAAMLAGLAACTTATPYQPDLAGQPVSGGYSEQRVGADRYRVTFSGNSLTSRERVEGYLLYRAAELTVQDGYDRFLIIDRLTERDTRTYVQPDPFYRPSYGLGYRYWRPHWRYRRSGQWRDWHPEWGDPFLAGSNVVTVEQFEAHAEIVMQRGTVLPNEERAFDARRVMADLGSTIERPEPRR